jgi:hypothetical protein
MQKSHVETMLTAFFDAEIVFQHESLPQRDKRWL